MTLDPGFTTPQLEDVFSPENRVAQFCRFEAALAEAWAEQDEIPAPAATAVVEACAYPVPDPEGLLAQGWEEGTPVLVLLERLRARLTTEQAQYLHRGATTQDVVDTALMLQCGAALGLVGDSLASSASSLVSLVEAHRQTPTLGRTFLQEATATSFGVRFALWLHQVTEARRELDRVRKRLPLQLGGPVGDTASLGADAFRLAERMAEQLGLAVPYIPWHTNRWPVQETAAVTGRAAAAASKIAGDVVLLSAFGEITVRSGRSSSMSHKRNPVDAIRAEAAAEVCRSAVAGLVSAPSHVLERGSGPWHAEWALVPMALESCGAAAEAIDRCLGSLRVQTDDQPPVDQAVAPELIDRVLGAHRALDTTL